ncbi:MAG: hypothetical protein ACIALR_12600 [Blastopirellula sp. JB062]
MSEIRVLCPCCGVTLRANPQLAGQTIRCPKCVSLVQVKGAEDDFAQPVEASYETVPLEEDNVGRACPKCANPLRPSAKLCQHCGWHLVLETYFEDLKAENLVVRETPKTKWETWFAAQLHESSRPRDVLVFSAGGGIVATIIFLAVAHFRMGAWALLTLPLLIGLWLGWYRVMQLIGLLHDPTRKRLLAKEEAERKAAAASAPPEEAPASDKTVSKKPTRSATELDLDLPAGEIAGQAKPQRPAVQTKKTVRPVRENRSPAETNAASKSQSAAPGKSAKEKNAPPAPSPKSPAQPSHAKPSQTQSSQPAPPKASDDDWLNELL